MWITDKMNVTGEAEAHLTISHIEMAGCFRLPPSTLSKIKLLKEKITGEIFKHGAIGQEKKEYGRDGKGFPGIGPTNHCLFIYL
jgi:hypothetical protein